MANNKTRAEHAKMGMKTLDVHTLAMGNDIHNIQLCFKIADLLSALMHLSDVANDGNVFDDALKFAKTAYEIEKTLPDIDE